MRGLRAVDTEPGRVYRLDNTRLVLRVVGFVPGAGPTFVDLETGEFSVYPAKYVGREHFAAVDPTLDRPASELVASALDHERAVDAFVDSFKRLHWLVHPKALSKEGGGP